MKKQCLFSPMCTFLHNHKYRPININLSRKINVSMAAGHYSLGFIRLLVNILPFLFVCCSWLS